jgi:hypothetical protein
MTIMSDSSENTSDFMHHLANLGSIYALICGFTFTTITLLITTFPNITEIRVQLVLLFLTVIFDVFVFLITWHNTEEIQYCRFVPHITIRMRILDTLTTIGLVLWGFSVPAMFLLWELNLLAIVTALIWVFGIIASYFTVYKNIKEYYKRAK